MSTKRIKEHNELKILTELSRSGALELNLN